MSTITFILGILIALVGLVLAFRGDTPGTSTIQLGGDKSISSTVTGVIVLVVGLAVIGWTMTLGSGHRSAANDSDPVPSVAEAPHASQNANGSHTTAHGTATKKPAATAGAHTTARANTTPAETTTPGTTTTVPATPLAGTTGTTATTGTNTTPAHTATTNTATAPTTATPIATTTLAPTTTGAKSTTATEEQSASSPAVDNDTNDLASKATAPCTPDGTSTISTTGPWEASAGGLDLQVEQLSVAPGTGGRLSIRLLLDNTSSDDISLDWGSFYVLDDSGVTHDADEDSPGWPGWVDLSPGQTQDGTITLADRLAPGTTWLDVRFNAQPYEDSDQYVTVSVTVPALGAASRCTQGGS